MHEKKTSWLGSVTVYTTHFIGAGLVFPAPAPILPVLVLPFQRVQARVKFGSGTGEIWYGKVIYIVKFYPSRATFFGTLTIFVRAVPKISCSVNGPHLVSPCQASWLRYKASWVQSHGKLQTHKPVFRGNHPQSGASPGCE